MTTACNQLAPAPTCQFIDQSTIPAPRFQLFDIAILHYESETGEVSDEVIQILGITWQLNRARDPGWWYHIRYLNKPVGIESYLEPGHQEDCQEDELLP